MCISQELWAVLLRVMCREFVWCLWYMFNRSFNRRLWLPFAKKPGPERQRGKWREAVAKWSCCQQFHRTGAAFEPFLLESTCENYFWWYLIVGQQVVDAVANYFWRSHLVLRSLQRGLGRLGKCPAVWWHPQARRRFCCCKMTALVAFHDPMAICQCGCTSIY